MFEMNQSWNHIENQQIAETIRDSRAKQLSSNRQRMLLFKELQVENDSDRRVAIDKIIQVTKSYIEQDMNEQLYYYLLSILRLSIHCPFIEVRQKFSAFLKERHRLIPTPKYPSPSYFISMQDIFSFETTSEGKPCDEYIRNMMIKIFLDEGRVSNLYRILLFFPTFFEIFYMTFNKTFKQQSGPLDRTWKSYIGLMVAAEQKCHYLASMMRIEFLMYGGDPTWLLGLDYIPIKLRNVSILIFILARHPWKLNQHILDGWTKGELVQVTLIIATTLGLSSFILGCGITPEVDMTGGFVIPNHLNHYYRGIERELENVDYSLVTEQLLIRENITNLSLQDDLNRFVEPHLNESIQLEIFNHKKGDLIEFMLSDYCFEDYGCDLINHYLPTIGDDLVNELNEAISITDWSIFHPSNERIDTSPLRNAIWYYTQKLLGIIKEDYNYSNITTFLNPRMLIYIQKVCTSAHEIEAKDWNNLGIQLRPEEKCHVNLLIASARKQSLLCYGLHLISEEMI